MAKGSAAPVVDNSYAIEEKQQEERNANRIREEERAAADLAKREANYSSSIANALSTARTRGAQILSDRGLTGDFADQILNSAIGNAQTRVPNLADNPATYFGDDIFYNELDGRRTNQRAKYSTEVRNMFGDNFATSMFADTADDPFIDSFLSDQRGNAISSLDVAKNRGNLNDTGYSRALSELERMGQAGRSTAQTLGGNVIQGYRDKANDISSRALGAAGNYDFGVKFDPGSYTNELSGLRTNFDTNLGGDVAGALAGQEFFDLGDILSRSGTAQGAVNAPTTGELDAIAERDRLRTANRGLGGTGSF